MIEGIPKISVIVICYKQEELIKRAINSLLAQKDYIYEICVSDDCSPDRTWEVLQEYDKQYPGLFKLHQNHPNVGIFENIEYTWTMPTGDIIYQLAGDDECGEGWLRKVVDFINTKNLDASHGSFAIYGNYECVYPNGDSLLLKNNLVTKERSAVHLSLRNLVCNRSVCYTRNILKRFKNLSKDRSHMVEQAQEIQVQLYSDKNYYINSVGNIYYSRIGVSSHITPDEFKERRLIRKYTMAFLKSEGYYISSEEMERLEQDSIYAVRENPQHSYWDYVVAFFRSYDNRYGLASLKLKILLFAIIRRFPHSKPIHF